MDHVVNRQRHNLSILILLSTLFAILVIGLGAYTRLVHAGLGCPDWPLCYGHLWAPAQHSDIVQANLNFPQAPVDLQKTWPEMTHRYLATSLGILCIAIVIFSVRLRRLSQLVPLKHALGLLCLIIVQGLFGMWTVTLKLWPQVVTLHLLGGFTTFCLLLLLYLRASIAPKIDNAPFKLTLLARVALLFCIGQIALGGWLTSNYAAMACVQLPLCDVSQLTSGDFSQGFNVFQQIGPNYLGGKLDGGARIAIHAVHRFGAIATLILTGSLAWQLMVYRQAIAARVITVLLSVQILLGLANVYFALPLINAVAHNVVGALLLASVVWVNYQLSGIKKTI